MNTKLLTIIAVFLFSIAIPTQAQINVGKLGKQIKRSAEQQVEQKVKTKSAETTRKTLNNTEKNIESGVSNRGTSRTKTSSGSSEIGNDIPKGTKTIYVSANGSNRNSGDKNAPLKDIQKAVDDAPEGAVIMVSEGNYQGRLDAGYVSIKKYISIIGGYSSDFSERNPVKYKTFIQPGPNAVGTAANYGLLDIYVRGKRDGLVLIDGLILDKGQMNKYAKNDPSNPRTGTPEGCETGRLVPPGFSTQAPTMRASGSVSNQLIHGDVEGNVVIRNCVLANGSHFAIQMGNIGGHFDIYNNVFINNRMAACEVRGMNKTPGESTVDFHNNTVFFTWRRDPMPENKDMGYGFRFMTRIDANVYNNIFGCTDFAALDRTYIDSDKNTEAARKTSAYDNLFFGNIEADLSLPSGGGKFLRIFAKSFEDVEQLIEYEGNREMNEGEIKKLSSVIDAAYLKGFLNMEGSTSSTYNPNSNENVARSVFGMPQRGTSSYTVSMYSNSYPIEKASNLFGAYNNYGAQLID